MARRAKQGGVAFGAAAEAVAGGLGLGIGLRFHHHPHSRLPSAGVSPSDTPPTQVQQPLPSAEEREAGLGNAW